MLLDIHMPVMDGLTAARRIRAAPGHRGRVPILAVTASANAAEVAACLDAGMDAHVEKPLRAWELQNVLAGNRARALRPAVEQGRVRSSSGPHGPGASAPSTHARKTMFLIPGIGNAMRINGRAWLETDPALLQSFAVEARPPRSVMVIRTDEVYFQCARALIRSGLWNPECHADPLTLPTPGQILAEISQGRVGGEPYDRNWAEQARQTLW